MQLIELLELCKDTYVSVFSHEYSRTSHGMVVDNKHIDEILLKDVYKYIRNEVISIRTGWDCYSENFNKEEIFTRIFIEIE